MAAAGWTRLVIVADDIITVIVQPVFDSKKPPHAPPWNVNMMPGLQEKIKEQRQNHVICSTEVEEYYVIMKTPKSQRHKNYLS